MTLERQQLEAEKLKLEEAIAKIEAEAKRLKDEVEKKERIAARISRVKESITRYEIKNAEQVKYTEAYFNQFPSPAKLVTDSKERTEGIYEDGEVVHTETWNDVSAHILYKGYTITVTEHLVTNKYAYRGVSKGYKMQMSGPGVDYKDRSRYYKSVKTLLARIDEFIEAEESKKKQAAKSLDAVQSTVAKLNELYPDATITADKGWEKGWETAHWSKRSGGAEYDRVTITFTNGIKMVYKVYSDGSLSRKEILFGNVNPWDLIEGMSKINLPVNQ